MIDHLEDNIRRVIADIRPQIVEKVIENWTSRLDYIRASRGIGGFCPTPPEELFPVLGEFVGLVGGQQLLFLERPKRALLDPCLQNTLAIPFVRFLRRKGNPPPG
ncbi:hypothetical protein TNCV_3151421 [Trichonephila clavipes]|nr:hypothetical protein TNCV_3151421 [Trichonephila clavipes]